MCLCCIAKVLLQLPEGDLRFVFEICRDCPEFDVSALKKLMMCDSTNGLNRLPKSTLKNKLLHIESGPEVLEIFKTQSSILNKHCFVS